MSNIQSHNCIVVIGTGSIGQAMERRVGAEKQILDTEYLLWKDSKFIDGFD